MPLDTSIIFSFSLWVFSGVLRFQLDTLWMNQ